MVQIPINMDSIEQKRNEWAENRRRVIARLGEIAEIMEGWYLGGRIANIGGSSLGIIGGSFILGGLFFPPLLVPGIVTSLIGAGGNIGASVGRLVTVKNRGEEVTRLLEEDARLLSAFVDEAEIYIQANAGIDGADTNNDHAHSQFAAGLGGAAAATAAALRALVAVLRRTFITVPLGAAGRHSLRAIAPAASTAPVRALAGVTAGIGMALDVVSLITAASSLARNESDELAAKLREGAEQLQKEMDEANAIALHAANEE